MMSINFGGYGMKNTQIFFSVVENRRGLPVNLDQLSHQRGARLWFASKIDQLPHFLSADGTIY